MIDPLDRLEMMIDQYTGPRSSQVTKETIILDLQNMASELKLIKAYVTSPPNTRTVAAPPLVKMAMELLFNHGDLSLISTLNDMPTLRIVEIINQAVTAAMPNATVEQKQLWEQVYQYWTTKQQLPKWQLPDFGRLVLNIVSVTVPGASIFTASNVQIMIDVIQGLTPWQAAQKHEAPLDFVIHMLVQTLPMLFLIISPTGTIPADLLEIRKWASEIIPLLEVFVDNA